MGMWPCPTRRLGELGKQRWGWSWRRIGVGKSSLGRVESLPASDPTVVVPWFQLSAGDPVDLRGSLPPPECSRGRMEGRKEGRMDGGHTVHPTPPPGTWGTSAPPIPGSAGGGGMFGCSPPFPTKCCLSLLLPISRSAPPKSAASPPNTHTQTPTHTTEDPMKWGGSPSLHIHGHGFPTAPSPAHPTSTELCFLPFPTLHTPVSHTRLVFPKFGSFPPGAQPQQLQRGGHSRVSVASG